MRGITPFVYGLTLGSLLGVALDRSMMHLTAASAHMRKLFNEEDCAAISVPSIASTSSDESSSLDGVLVGASDETRYSSSSCSELLSQKSSGRAATKNDTTPTNNEMLHKKLTTTDPPFWISLHSKQVDKVRWAIMEHGFYYEKFITDHFKQILKDYKPKSLVIDVGMNIGWFSLWVRALGHRTISFEPNLINRVRLCESLLLNNWTEQEVNVYEYGVGEKSESLEFVLDRGNNPGMGGFVRKRDVSMQFQGKRETMQVITLDEFGEAKGWFAREDPIPLLKVDVEGLDPQVFMGAKRLLAMGVVKNILMEYSCAMSEKVDMHNVVKQLLLAQYTIKLIGGWNGKEISGSLEAVNINKTDDLSGSLYRFCKHR